MWQARVHTQKTKKKKKKGKLPPSPGDGETFAQQYEHQKEDQETDGEQ